MTYHHRKQFLPQPSPVAETTRRLGFAHAAPTAISAARASTALALSMTVALRYLEGRDSREARHALADPALS